MRKLLTLFVSVLISGTLLAGGLVTNNNQSAMYTRLQNRNASTDIDAVYFNPAGLTKLQDGFHFSLNNQSIFQTQTITNNYTYLSGEKPKEYVGDVSAPFTLVFMLHTRPVNLPFPQVSMLSAVAAALHLIQDFLHSKCRSPTLSLHFRTSWLPLIRHFWQLPDTDPGFRNVTGYNADIFFEGKSFYLGYQANVSYAITDMISAAVGIRYVSAKNTYKGSISNATINAPAAYGGTQTPGNYLRTIAGIPGVPAPIAAQLSGTASYLDVVTNVEADAEMTGSGFTPILSLNIAPSDKINLSLRYEFQTKMDLTTTVNDGKDGGGIFIQDSVAIADMPASLSVGLDVIPMDKLTLSASFNCYFDKNVDYDGQEDVDINMIDNNFLEFGLGAQYAVAKR